MAEQQQQEEEAPVELKKRRTKAISGFLTRGAPRRRKPKNARFGIYSTSRVDHIRDLFTSLDSDGSGTVLPPSPLLSLLYPRELKPEPALF